MYSRVRGRSGLLFFGSLCGLAGCHLRLQLLLGRHPDRKVLVALGRRLDKPNHAVEVVHKAGLERRQGEELGGLVNLGHAIAYVDFELVPLGDERGLGDARPYPLAVNADFARSTLALLALVRDKLPRLGGHLPKRLVENRHGLKLSRLGAFGGLSGRGLEGLLGGRASKQLAPEGLLGRLGPDILLKHDRDRPDKPYRLEALVIGTPFLFRERRPLRPVFHRNGQPPGTSTRSTGRCRECSAAWAPGRQGGEGLGRRRERKEAKNQGTPRGHVDPTRDAGFVLAGRPGCRSEACGG
mmetsp:Transcript_14811/g.37083  ORF Transcript_14811/g.37083 Transcript_14811/m.37083 type:complete len:297 (+) Transcript_14811:49-939(+)